MDGYQKRLFKARAISIRDSWGNANGKHQAAAIQISLPQKRGGKGGLADRSTGLKACRFMRGLPASVAWTLPADPCERVSVLRASHVAGGGGFRRSSMS